MLGNGHGQFGSPAYYPVGRTPNGVATADLDQEGDQDLAVANVSGSFDGAAASVLLDNGDGTFGPTSNFTFGGNGPTINSVAVGELTNDDKPDLAFTAQFSSPSSVFVIPGNGDGTLGTAIQYPVGGQASRVVIGNLNADSSPDLAVANYGSNATSVLLNRAPTATATPASVNFPGREVGTESDPQAIDILNTFGGDPMNVGQIEVTGPDASDFTLDTDDCSDATIVFGDQCQVKLTFNPSSFGSRNATLTVPWNSAESPLEVPLGGTGMDVDPPDTTIDSGPSGPVANASPNFSFHGTAGDTAKLMCRLDEGAFADCVSPATFPGLTDGPHTLTVRAEDASGNQDPTPATRSFAVDTTPPDTILYSGPSGTIVTNYATFSFRGDPEADTATFMCKLDRGAFAACESPVSYTGLSDGLHVFTVRAEDALGNHDLTPPTRDFMVDTKVERLPKARIGALEFTGPVKATKNRKVPFTIRIPNTGDATATGVRLTVRGRGISFRRKVGQIAAGSTRTLKVKLRFRKTGKVKATLRVTSTNAGTRTERKTIRVRK